MRARTPGRGRARGHGLGIFEARLAEMGVEIEEPGRHDDATVRYAGGFSALEPYHRLEHAVRDDDLTRSLAARNGIDEPGLIELEPLDDFAHGRTECGFRRPAVGGAHRTGSPATASCAPASR
jgi:hypothetical protein